MSVSVAPRGARGLSPGVASHPSRLTDSCGPRSRQHGPRDTCWGHTPARRVTRPSRRSSGANGSVSPPGHSRPPAPRWGSYTTGRRTCANTRVCSPARTRTYPRHALLRAHTGTHNVPPTLYAPHPHAPAHTHCPPHACTHTLSPHTHTPTPHLHTHRHAHSRNDVAAGGVTPPPARAPGLPSAPRRRTSARSRAFRASMEARADGAPRGAVGGSRSAGRGGAGAGRMAKGVAGSRRQGGALGA